MNNENNTIQTFFSQRYEQYTAFGYDMEKERRGILKAALPFKNPILEIGSGKGYFALALAKFGRDFISIDTSAEDQSLAKTHLQSFGVSERVRFEVQDASATTFTAGEFKTIFAVNLLHHLDHPIAVLDEMIRILDERGKIIISDFTEKGFHIVDQLHQKEGHSHPVSPFRMPDAKKYFEQNHFDCYIKATDFQETFIIKRKID